MFFVLLNDIQICCLDIFATTEGASSKNTRAVNTFQHPLGNDCILWSVSTLEAPLDE